MANTKWTLYKVVNGEKVRITGSEADSFVVDFPGNATDIVDNYVVTYDSNGIKPEEFKHNVLTGSSCVTQPTKCDCEKISLIDNNDVTLAYNDKASGKKQYTTMNNCQLYYKVDYPFVEGNEYNWLNVNNSGSEIGFTAKSECLQERQAIISVYYDESRTEDTLCDSFKVFQNSKTDFLVKLEIVIYTKGMINDNEKVSITATSSDKGIKIYRNNNVIKTIASVTGTKSANGYKSDTMSMTANSLLELINSLKIDGTSAIGDYRHNNVGVRLDTVLYDAYYNLTVYKTFRGGSAISDSMFCNEDKDSLCLNAISFIGKPSDYMGNGLTPDTNGVDVLIRYDVRLGGGDITR